MSTILKLKNSSKWQAQIARKGIRKSKSFKTKTEAKDWAARQEYLITSNSAPNLICNKTFSNALDKYIKEISPTKKGERSEVLRLESFNRSFLAPIKLQKITHDDIIKWRDNRLRQVSPPSVLREMGIISNVFNVAIKEWRWITLNPLADIKKPPNSKPRDRRITQDEINTLVEVMTKNGEPNKVALIFLFAIETGMRAGEICKLSWENVDIENRVALLLDTKNGTNREVPLSRKAIEILRALPRVQELCFNTTPRRLDGSFRKYRDKTTIKDLHFHDTRHEAITRLAQKFSVLPLARIIGHSNINQLQTYYNESAKDLVRFLD